MPVESVALANPKPLVGKYTSMIATIVLIVLCPDYGHSPTFCKGDLLYERDTHFSRSSRINLANYGSNLVDAIRNR